MAALAASAEARASCIDQASCICELFGSERNAGFVGTVRSGPDQSTPIEVRLDTVTVIGESTKLTPGSVFTIARTGDEGRALPGDRVIGISFLACPKDDPDCAVAAQEERVELRQVFSGSVVRCGGTVLPLTPEAAAALMLDSGCSTEVNRLLEDAGVDTGCCDTGPCTARPGPIPSTGWAGLVGVAVLLARRRLRRGSTRAA